MTEIDIKPVIEGYRVAYPEWERLDSDIAEALKVYKDNDHSQIRQLWRDCKLTTTARDVATDCHNFVNDPQMRKNMGFLV